MLTIVNQRSMAKGIEIELSDNTSVYVRDKSDIDTVLIEHERWLLDNINIGGEEQEEYTVELDSVPSTSLGI